jgi:hypothetical protein
MQYDCVQAIVTIRRAKSQSRAVRAAQKRFERLRRLPHWDVGADAVTITPLTAEA